MMMFSCQVSASLGAGSYALIRDNTQFDLSFSFESQGWESKPFQIETDVLSSSMSASVFGGHS